MTVNKTWTSAAAGGTLDLSTGQLLTETVWDALISNLNHLGGTTGYIAAIGERSTNQSISNNSATAVTFPTEVIDSDGIFTASGSTMTIQTEGVYLCFGWCSWAANGTGRRNLTLTVSASSSDPTDRRDGISGDPQENIVVFVGRMAASDTVQLTAFQDSGGSLNINRALLAVVKL